MSSAPLHLGAIAFAAAGCCTIELCDGGKPLAPEELPEWVTREIPLQRRPDLLQAAAATVQADPARYVETWRVNFKQGELRRYDIGRLLPSGYCDNPVMGMGGLFAGFGADYGPSLRGDGLPGHRFLYDRQRDQGIFLLFDVITVDIQRFDTGAGRPPDVVRVRAFMSFPYTSWSSAVPADEPVQEYLRKTVDGEREGPPDRYRVVEEQGYLLGLFGWGRVNRTNYLQLLWIPIPIGEAEVPAVRR